jgi:hypothetical protein
MFSVKYDDKNGIIRCLSPGGFMTVAEVNQSAAAVYESMQRCRKEFGGVSMLVLTRDTTVQSAEVMEATKNNMRRMGPNDRVAIVVSSQLAKMQGERTLDTKKLRAFASEPEARAWLVAERSRLFGAAPRAAAA